MRIYDRFTCPEPSLSPPEEEEDTTSYCQCCGRRNLLSYRYRDDKTEVGCEHCITELAPTGPFFRDSVDCPECKSEAEKVYMDRSSGKIIGCDSCIEVVGTE